MSIPLIIMTSIPPPAYLLPLYRGCLTANLSTLTENTSFFHNLIQTLFRRLFCVLLTTVVTGVF